MFYISYVQPVGQLKVLCGPSKVLAAVKASYVLTTNLYFDILNLTFLMQLSSVPFYHVCCHCS